MAATQQRRPAAPPILYNRPVPIRPETFRGKSFFPSARFGFARKTNVIPLNAVEFISAQRHYPIVFGHEENEFPLAIVGLRRDRNLYIDTDGQWHANAYVPAYVRRYPFMLLRRPEKRDYVLCADVESEFVTDGDANSFFRKGKPTETVKRAASICQAFQSAAARTREFCAALGEHDLLKVQSAFLSGPNGDKIKLGPFRVVDEEKFAALPTEVLADWHCRGWLRLIHAHLFSLSNWSGLAARSTAN